MYWLHCEPPEDFAAWRAQVGRAAWVEERFFTTLARMIHGDKGQGPARK